MLLQSLVALSAGECDSAAIASLTTQLADVTASCDGLMLEVLRAVDQRAVVGRDQEVRIDPRHPHVAVVRPLDAKRPLLGLVVVARRDRGRRIAADVARGHGRLHHVTYATDQREDILRAADIFLQNGVHIETGPHKHAIQGTFYLYVWEPAGNPVELANAGARLILAPDWQPVVWTEADRRKGQAWGLKTIESFHTHGTPTLEEMDTEGIVY